MTISEIARRIEALRPGTLPKSYAQRLLHDKFGAFAAATGTLPCPQLPDDIARDMLIGAMVMATKARRGENGWEVVCLVRNDFGGTAFHTIYLPDSDHGNDPLRSLLAAFERVYATEAANG